jgi:hypothetical protein
MKDGKEKWECRYQENGRDYILGAGTYQAKAKCQVGIWSRLVCSRTES